MGVEFTLEFNVESSTRGNYRDFIQNLRVRLGVRFSHNRPALAIQTNNPPDIRFFDLVLRINDHAVRFRFRMDNLYLIGYQMENGQWLEFDNRDRNNQLVHLITEPGTNFLGFEGSYVELERVAHQTTDRMRVGVHSLVYAINQLAVTTSWEDRARSLVVVIMMISESTRLIPVFNYVASSFDNRLGTSRFTESQIEPWIMDLVTSWKYFSGVLLRADAYPEESFQFGPNNIRIPPDGTLVTTIAAVVDILGICLGLCFYPRGQQRDLTFGDDGKCYLGIPIVQVFSVQINNIDGEDPGQLYGTIIVDNGLHTEFIYNRSRDNHETIKPGQNASLIGPSQSVSAFGNFTIKLVLTDKDIISWFDDVIINQVISWNSSNIGIVYDELLSKKLDCSRGSVNVNYAVLQNAAAARITVAIEEGGEAIVDVYGHVSACYDKWEDPQTTCLLFERTSDNYVEVRRWQTIPLLRSVVAVPLDHSLKVTASLYDHDTFSHDDEIANGIVEVPVPDTIPSTTFKRIDGKDGNYVTVTVYWSSGF